MNIEESEVIEGPEMAEPAAALEPAGSSEPTPDQKAALRKRRLVFLAKAAGVLGILFLLSRTAPIMPAPLLALCWAALSGLLAVTAAYHHTIRKTHKQTMYKAGGVLGRINSGRLLTLLVGFVISAFCIGCLIVESPKWDAYEWLVVALAPFLYLLVSHATSKFVKAELKEEYQRSRAAILNSVLVAVLLCIAYACLNALLPMPEYASLEETLKLIPRPFENSPSALMSVIGQYSALADGITAFALAKAGEASLPAYIAWKLVLSGSALISVAGLMDLCFLDWEELKKAFQPLEVGKRLGRHGRNYPLERRFVAVAVALPLCLVVAFCALDLRAAQTVEAEGYSEAESFVQQQSEVLVYLIDGHYYDAQAVEALRAEAEEAAKALKQEAKEELAPLINASYDARIANVDNYLDWYYSPAAEYERLLHSSNGSSEEFMRGMFEEKIEAGIDDSELKAAIESYSERANALQTNLMSQLEEYEVTGVPDSLVSVVDTLDTDFLAKPLEPATEFVTAQNDFFLHGTIGLGISMGVHFLSLKVDELLNREKLREEIIAEIEKSRAEKLAFLEGE